MIKSKICTILGARPQFIKASPLSLELRKYSQEILIHTGQHYDYGLSEIFFEELSIPKPKYHLGIGSGNHGVQTGAMLGAIEKVLLAEKPDMVITYGDTNSTLAGALAAAKLHIPVAHVEAGLRSFNRRMPEEINRVLTDHLSSWLFVPSEVSRQNLENEGITQNVRVVGDIMFDAILIHSNRAQQTSYILQRLKLMPQSYYLATIHRAENTDNLQRLQDILSALAQLSKRVILPLHPRTRKKLVDFGLQLAEPIQAIKPVGYLEMVQLMQNADCILTDSGGIQKEAYYVGIPCVTLRDETEWLETVEVGWNVIVGTSIKKIVETVQESNTIRARPRPYLYGDGTTAQKIVEVLLKG
jgi:UDP-N-acetylglucosamine 2-epimerase